MSALSVRDIWFRVSLYKRTTRPSPNRSWTVGKIGSSPAVDPVAVVVAAQLAAVVSAALEFYSSATAQVSFFSDQNACC